MDKFCHPPGLCSGRLVEELPIDKRAHDNQECAHKDSSDKLWAIHFIWFDLSGNCFLAKEVYESCLYVNEIFITKCEVYDLRGYGSIIC